MNHPDPLTFTKARLSEWTPAKLRHPDAAERLYRGYGISIADARRLIKAELAKPRCMAVEHREIAGGVIR